MSWLKRLFSRKKKEKADARGPITGVLDENGDLIDDENMLAVINAAYRSGKPVIANVRDDGTLEIKEIDL